MDSGNKIDRMRAAARFRSVPIDVEIELGQTAVTMRELLAFKEGSVLMTRKPLGDPLDVRVGGVLMAHATLLQTKKKVSVRLTGWKTRS